MNSASLNEIAYNLLNNMRGGRSSHSDHLSLEQVKFMIKYYRSLFIRRDLERNYNRWRAFEQDLGLVPVSIVDSAEHDTITSGRLLMRTDDKIPTPIRLKRGEAISHIGDVDRVGKPIPLIDTVRSYYQRFNKYTSEDSFAFYRDGYVYIENDVTLNNINIRGVFEDPEKVHAFTIDNDLDLYDENSPFPISMDMLQQITQGLMNGELSAVVQTPNDEELDRMQDSNPQ